MVDLRTPSLSAGVAAVLLLVPAISSAAPVDLVSDGRFVRTAINLCDAQCEEFMLATDSVSAADFEDWTARTNTPGFQAAQTSVVGPRRFAGTGEFLRLPIAGPPGFFPEGEGDGDSVFSITFDVVQPTAIDFSGVLTADSGAFGGSSRYSLALTTGQILFSDRIDADVSPAMRDFALQTILQPGEYELNLRASLESHGTVAYDFEFLVPEPGSGTLLAMALLWMLGSSRSDIERPGEQAH